MIFPLIKVRDKRSNGGYILGTDPAHHELLVDENGSLQFYNSQSGDRTGKHGTFEFIAEQGSYGMEIKFGTIWDVLNIYGENLGVQDSVLYEEFENALRKLERVFQKAKENKLQELKLKKAQLIEGLEEHEIDVPMSLEGGLLVYTFSRKRYKSEVSPEGRKVKYLDTNGTDFNLKAARRYLEKGDVLTIKEIYVDRSSSNVEFQEYPGIFFNTVMFTNIENEK